jgi:tetratricopeptide (TPR) repeat protein
VKISPENHEFLLQRSMLYLAQKRYQETIKDLTQSLKYRENDPFILYKKGVALYLSLDFKQALYNLLLALENNPISELPARHLLPYRTCLGKFGGIREGDRPAVQGKTWE